MYSEITLYGQLLFLNLRRLIGASLVQVLDRNDMILSGGLSKVSLSRRQLMQWLTHKTLHDASSQKYDPNFWNKHGYPIELWYVQSRCEGVLEEQACFLYYPYGSDTEG